MKLRNLLLTVSACYCTFIMAQTNMETKLHKVESPELLKSKIERPVSAASRISQRAEAASRQLTEPRFSFAAMKAKAQANGSQLRLDSIIKTNPDGSNYTRMYFTFDERNLTTRQLNSYWNAETNSWDTAEEYNYEWDQDGYVLMQSAEIYGGGERRQYTYNDRKLGITQIFSILIDGEWINQWKGEYKYDDKDNMIDEMIYSWDGTTWVKATHSTATWDEQNRQTSIESTYWNGTEWVGETKEAYTYYLDTTDKLTYKGMYRWLADTKQWQLVDMFFQEFNQAGQLTAQKRKFWNDERKDWSGEYESWGPGSGILYTYDAIITYDELGRTTLQQHKECYNDSTEWVVRSEMVTEWKDGLENGDYESEMNAYLYDYPSGKRTWNQREYGRYNAQGVRTWVLQQMQNPEATEMNDYYEEKYRYDERGNLLYSASWDWEDGIRKPTIEENNTYDADNNIIESYYRSGNSGGGIVIGSPQKAAGHEPQDDEGWVNTSHFTYKYENGYRIEKMGYRWNGTDWAGNMGQSIQYDWNVPTSELIVALGYTDPYKIDYMKDYTGNGNGEWLISTTTYYYSDQASGIRQTESGTITFADNILTVTGGNDIENRVYDLTGKQVYQGNNPQENLNRLSKGIYIVRSKIDNKSYTLKIIIQ